MYLSYDKPYRVAISVFIAQSVTFRPDRVSTNLHCSFKNMESEIHFAFFDTMRNWTVEEQTIAEPTGSCSVPPALYLVIVGRGKALYDAGTCLLIIHCIGG